MFLCLPHLLPTVNLKKRKKTAAEDVQPSEKKKANTWRPSKVECLESFLHVVSSDTVVKDSVLRRNGKAKEQGINLQPYAIAVGPILSEIKHYFIVVNDVFYKVKTCLTAIDTCFKILMQLNAEYPGESVLVWSFIQQGLYELHTVYDKKFTAVNSLMSELGMREHI